MKKNLIALAVLAAAGAASAQSSVTLYGRVDAGLVSAKDSLTPVAGDGVTRTKLQSNVLNNSLWGFKGTEDLGNGLKANFVLESGMNMDDGSASVAGTTFNRKSTVGLSGDFGTVELGRNYTAYDSLRGATNNTVDTNMAVTNDVWAAGSGYESADFVGTGTVATPQYKKGAVVKARDYANRVNNSVRFDSNTYGGFSGSVAYGFGENKATGKDSTDNLSLHIKYANGPLLVGYAHQTEKAATGADAKYNLIGGSYDLGVAKLVAGYNKTKGANIVDHTGATVGGAESTGYQLGVSAPFGATTVYFGYAAAKNELATGVEFEKRSGFDLAATYALSKRTTAYVGYKAYEIKDADKEATAFGVGVRHVF